MSDKPFVLRGGDDEQTAMYNRIAAIDRIKFLSGVDLREKSAFYLRALDLELYKRWYKDEPPDRKIDETFCQRAAEVVAAMEGKPATLDEKELTQAFLDHQSKLQNKDKKKDDSQHAQSLTQNVGEAQQNKS